MEKVSSASIEELFLECTGEFFEEQNLFASRSRTGIFSAASVVWLGIQQRLEDKSLAGALSSMLEGSFSAGVFGRNTKSKKSLKISNNTGGISKARSRLSLDMCKSVLMEISKRVWKTTQTKNSTPVFLIDGSIVTTARTESILEKFPCHRNQFGKFHYPKVRIVAAHCATSGVATAIKSGSTEVSEQALAKMVFEDLPRGSIVILDRGFAAPGLVYAAQQCGLTVVVRLPSKVAGKLKRLGDDGGFVSWQGSKGKDTPIVKGTYIQAKGTSFGGVPLTLELFTTTNLSAEEVASLYALRWDVELYIRQVKQTLALNFIKARTPENVEKEIYFAYMVFNLLRTLLCTAATATGAPLKQLSFTSVLRLSKSFSHMFLRAAGDKNKLSELCDDFFLALKQSRNARKPGSRSFPREVKLTTSHGKYPRKPLEAKYYVK